MNKVELLKLAFGLASETIAQADGAELDIAVAQKAMQCNLSADEYNFFKMQFSAQRGTLLGWAALDAPKRPVVAMGAILAGLKTVAKAGGKP